MPLRLFITGTSPFVRMCRVVIRERHLLDQIEEIPIGPEPLADSAYLGANPSGQGPVLVYDGGSLVGPSAICRLLDRMGHSTPLGGGDFDTRLAVGERLGFALAVTEFAVHLMHEIKRPDNERSPTWIAKWQAGLKRTLDRLESLDVEAVDLGTIATAIALTYLDFRLPNLEWREQRPRLAALQIDYEQRESFVTTHPIKRPSRSQGQAHRG